MSDPLPSWNDGAAKAAIVAFVESIDVPEPERVAVFDNDGTQWCERPMPVELGFILQRPAEMAEEEPPLRERQPWKAAHERDHKWLGDTMTKHYQPMIELLRYLEANAFTTYIASGGDRDFMRPVTHEIYGIPPERVVGSSNALRYEDGAVVYKAEPDVFDDGPVKPVRIWSRIGRRSLMAAGNSNGDLEMLEFSPGLRLRSTPA